MAGLSVQDVVRAWPPICGVVAGFAAFWLAWRSSRNAIVTAYLRVERQIADAFARCEDRAARYRAACPVSVPSLMRAVVLLAVTRTAMAFLPLEGLLERPWNENPASRRRESVFNPRGFLS